MTTNLATETETTTDEPLFTLRYTRYGSPVQRLLPAAKVEVCGRVIIRIADRNEDAISDIEVLNPDGEDVTFDFACFRD